MDLTGPRHHNRLFSNLSDVQTTRSEIGENPEPHHLRTFHTHSDVSYTTSELPPENTIELHVPGHNYMGPGTHINQRLRSGLLPVDADDELSRQHDINYNSSVTYGDIDNADHTYLKALYDLNRVGKTDIVGPLAFDNLETTLAKILFRAKDKAWNHNRDPNVMITPDPYIAESNKIYDRLNNQTKP